MRYLFIGILALSLLGACTGNDKPATAAQQATADTANFTTIQWLDTEKDFGKMQYGPELEVAFRFKNTGDKPLVISKIQPSCGCTTAKEMPAPVPPGGEGVIKATFKSQGHPGLQHKTITVFSNTKVSQVSTLKFQVEVEKPAENKN